MSTRVSLGKTNLQVSPLCFGTWQLSPRFWGNVEESNIIQAVRTAYDADINFFDTAGAYGEGHAETVLGKAIKQIPRDKIVIATKVFWHLRPESAGGGRFPDLSHGYILQECDDCLKRLQIDHIDLFQCHAWDPLGNFADIAGAMDKLVKQGKIRAYGTSNWSVEQIRYGSQLGQFQTCQPHYCLLCSDAEKDIFPYCLASNIGVLSFSSLHLGLLTGKYTGAETFNDFRGKHPDFIGERFKSLADRVRKTKPIADKYNLTITQLILVATLLHPAITCTIVGVKSPDQISESAGAMGKTISREDYFRLRDLLKAP